jgi:hypothetical protein
MDLMTVEKLNSINNASIPKLLKPADNLEATFNDIDLTLLLIMGEALYHRKNPPFFSFLAWSDDKTGKGTLYKPQDNFIVTKANTILYAIWKEK